MRINIDMEAWELATVIKGLTINAQPEEKKPEGVKPILSDKTREELKRRLPTRSRCRRRLPYYRKERRMDNEKNPHIV